MPSGRPDSAPGLIGPFVGGLCRSRFVRDAGGIRRCGLFLGCGDVRGDLGSDALARLVDLVAQLVVGTEGLGAACDGFLGVACDFFSLGSDLRSGVRDDPTRVVDGHVGTLSLRGPVAVRSSGRGRRGRETGGSDVAFALPADFLGLGVQIVRRLVQRVDDGLTELRIVHVLIGGDGAYACQASNDQRFERSHGFLLGRRAEARLYACAALYERAAAVAGFVSPDVAV